jgi:hypothetical protein
MNVEAFVAGYRLGHDGQPPAFSMSMLEHELADVESDKPPTSTDWASDQDWAWHLIGWTVGQAIVMHGLHWPGATTDKLEG